MLPRAFGIDPLGQACVQLVNQTRASLHVGTREATEVARDLIRSGVVAYTDDGFQTRAPTPESALDVALPPIDVDQPLATTDPTSSTFLAFLEWLTGLRLTTVTPYQGPGDRVPTTLEAILMANAAGLAARMRVTYAQWMPQWLQQPSTPAMILTRQQLYADGSATKVFQSALSVALGRVNNMEEYNRSLVETAYLVDATIAAAAGIGLRLYAPTRVWDGVRWAAGALGSTSVVVQSIVPAVDTMTHRGDGVRETFGLLAVCSYMNRGVAAGVAWVLQDVGATLQETLEATDEFTRVQYDLAKVATLVWTEMQQQHLHDDRKVDVALHLIEQLQQRIPRTLNATELDMYHRLLRAQVCAEFILEFFCEVEVVVSEPGVAQHVLAIGMGNAAAEAEAIANDVSPVVTLRYRMFTPDQEPRRAESGLATLVGVLLGVGEVTVITPLAMTRRAIATALTLTELLRNLGSAESAADGLAALFAILDHLLITVVLEAVAGVERTTVRASTLFATECFLVALAVRSARYRAWLLLALGGVGTTLVLPIPAVVGLLLSAGGAAQMVAGSQPWEAVVRVWRANVMEAVLPGVDASEAIARVPIPPKPRVDTAEPVEPPFLGHRGADLGIMRSLTGRFTTFFDLHLRDSPFYAWLVGSHSSTGVPISSQVVFAFASSLAAAQ